MIPKTLLFIAFVLQQPGGGVSVGHSSHKPFGPRVSVTMNHREVADVLAALFKAGHAKYRILPGVRRDQVSFACYNMPLEEAVRSVLDAAQAHPTYRIVHGVFVIAPHQS